VAHSAGGHTLCEAEPLTPQLNATGVSKLFAGQCALDNVNLELPRGETHALLGANGSGKSTFIKILAGYHVPEDGATIEVAGVPLATGSPRASHRAGLRFIHQELGLINVLDAAENLSLGKAYGGSWWLSNKKEWKAARDLVRSYGLEIDPREPLEALSTAEKSMLAIIRAIEDGLGEDGLLVLDEPTASLPPNEVDQLVRLLGELKSRGVTILYVTHRLAEVFRLADRVTVLSDGRSVATEDIADIDADRLLRLIVGKDVSQQHSPAPTSAAGSATDHDVVLDVRDLEGEGVAAASFQIRAGEVVGLAGLLGSGYESVLGIVFGVKPSSNGAVICQGSPLKPLSPASAIRKGITYAPSNRRLSTVLNWTICENLTLPALKAKRRSRWIDHHAELRDAGIWLRRLSVKPAEPNLLFSNLSGGNQQKAIVARMLRCNPKVLLLEEPTIGVDGGARLEIHEELRAAARAGSAVVVSSSDSEELSQLCDRILVFGNGRIVQELTGSLDSESIFASCLMAGSTTPMHNPFGASA
jgi:ribose transport system ATP-binding protein